MKYEKPEMEVVELDVPIITGLSTGDENTTVPDIGTMQRKGGNRG